MTDELEDAELQAGEGYTVNEDGTASIASLEPDASVILTATYTVTEADVLAGSVKNEATATGTSPDPDDPNPPIDPGEKEEPTEDLDTTLSVNKKISNTPANGEAYVLGETIEYSITVTNEGNVTYSNIAVKDEDTGFETTIETLAVGESKDFTTSHEVTEADIIKGSYTNTVTAKGDPIDDPKDPENPKTPEGEDTTTTGDEDDPDGPNPPIEEKDAHITITKVTTSTPENGKAYAKDEEITYEITVTNDGNLTITDITVTDELTGDEWTIASLAPEATEVFEATYTVTSDDVKNGSVLNEATAKGTSPDPDEPDVPVEPGKKEDPTYDKPGTGEPRVILTYITNGGSMANTYTMVTANAEYRLTTAKGATISLSDTPFREGHTFMGWFSDEGFTTEITEIKMDTDKTVYALWDDTPVPHNLNGDDHFAYIVGYPDGTVMPEANIKRSEVATIFFRLLKDDIREEYLTTENDFTDVDDTKWYNTAISTLANLGIIDGYDDGGFHPENPITRAEFVAMAARFDARDANRQADFSDISGHWATDEISRAAQNGWIDGYSDGTFLPNAKIKRSEAMAIINRVLHRLPAGPEDLLPDMVVWPDNMNESKWYYLHVQEATNSHECKHRADGSEYWIVLTEVPDWERYER